MPTYEYVCKDCGGTLEVVQSFSDDALTECPTCQGQLRKVFGAVGIAFKGSGFYKNDSRSKSTTPKSTSGADAAKASDAPSKDSKDSKDSKESAAKSGNTEKTAATSTS